MKYKQDHPGFELETPSQFTITIIVRFDNSGIKI